MPQTARAQSRIPRPLVYPDSDGEPMADNTLQYRWIVTIKENLDDLLPDFVAGNILWYPIEGDNVTRIGPDVLVALGRPKGERGSYQTWMEDGVVPQVIFEVLSPSNTIQEMARKRQFYQRFGVEEYYVLDPEHETLDVYLRQDGRLELCGDLDGFRSPRLGIHFTYVEDQLKIYGPDGQVFLTWQENAARAHAAEARAEQAQARAEQERIRAERLAARLRALGLDPEG